MPAYHACRTIIEANKIKWNYINEMSVEKSRNEICDRGERSNSEKILPRPRFVHHDTHMEGPRRELGTPAVGGERLTAFATGPPNNYYIFDKCYNIFCYRMQFFYDYLQSLQLQWSHHYFNHVELQFCINLWGIFNMLWILEY